MLTRGTHTQENLPGPPWVAILGALLEASDKLDVNVKALRIKCKKCARCSLCGSSTVLRSGRPV